MPFVAGYFRRSPGGAAQPPAPRRPDVAIYAADGSLLEDRGGARYRVEGLTFDSQLPGGFWSASFTLRGRESQPGWPGRAGLRMMVRRGARVLWWGWVEDVRRKQRGRLEEIQVSALGPWQQLQQRLISPDYSMYTTIYSEDALAWELSAACSELSGDFSHLAETGINLAPLTWALKPVSDLVKLVCSSGDSQGRQMLFALWDGRRQLYPVSAVANAGFEIAQTAGAQLPASWAVNGLGWAWSRTAYHGALHSLKHSAVGATTVYVQQANTPCAGGTYTVSYWSMQTAGVQSYFTVVWKDAAGATLGTVTGPANSTSFTGWVNWVASGGGYANATSYTLTLWVIQPSAGGTCYLDDVAVYVEQIPDVRPTPYLWPRDLSAADYLLFTGQLDVDDTLAVTETTRDMANAVLAAYGEPTAYTGWAQDAAAQGLYRRRDALVRAGAVSSSVATALRDAHLARYKAPRLEAGEFVVSPGAVRREHGGVVWPEDLRAGDRLRVADGPAAGQVLLLTRVRYADGIVTCTPEQADDVPLLLAKATRA